MSLLAEILTWSEADLPLWQRDALRRLFQQDSDLTDTDYDELYSLLKTGNGISIPSKLESVALSAANLPSTPEPGTKVVMIAMRDLQHVNRLESGQTLTFSPSGITIIYGANASGKSGYARVMKKTCRARDKAEAVLPDANLPIDHTRIPSAVFDIDVNGTSKDVLWKADAAPPTALSQIAVFDSHCARVYLTKEQDVEYLPYGLDIVRNLAHNVLPELEQRLDSELATISVDEQPFQHLLGDTRVGLLIYGLNAQSNPEDVDTLATMSEVELSRLEELRSTLSEADPKARVGELRLSAKRIKELTDRADAAHDAVDDEAVNRLKSQYERTKAALSAENAAAHALRAGEKLLLATGESGWKVLFEAARKFSVESAYPGCPFPHTDDQAQCPLCQQTFSFDTAERMRRFEKYIQEDVAKTANLEREALNAARRDFEQVLLRIGLDESLEAEIESLDDSVSLMIRTFEESLEERRTGILTAVANGPWDSIPSPGENPRGRLRRIATSQLCRARTCARAVRETDREALKAELAELEARSNLASCSEAVRELVCNLKRKSALERCRLELKTRPISDKSKDLASAAVTAALRSALETEFESLDMGHVKLELKDRIERGGIKHRLVLNLPTSGKLGEILSEGEQRAIALGSFLAELSISSHKGGIVFDDPVSSLDHWRRRNVAKRLVAEASRRQVIVFTHDTSFLGQLRDEIEAVGVPHQIQFLEWMGGEPGHVQEGLPWEHQNYKERIDSLEKAQRQLARIPWPKYPNQVEVAEMAHQYSLLRATIERVIQDVVFAGVVKRYRDWIRIDLLERAVGFELPECLEIRRLHKRCCEVVDAHDRPSEKIASVPTANDLAQDIQLLKDVIEKIKQSRKPAAAPITP